MAESAMGAPNPAEEAGLAVDTLVSTERAEPSPASDQKGKESALVTRLGFEPASDEVAAMLEAVLSERLVSGKDRVSMVATVSALRRGEADVEVAYTRAMEILARSPLADKALDTLGHLYAAEDVIELRAVSLTGGAVSYNGRLSAERKEMADFIRRHLGWANLYFGVNPRVPSFAGLALSGKASDVKRRHLLVLDLDNKDAPDHDPGWHDTISNLDRHSPVMIVHSGNGFHVWFALQPLAGDDLVNSVPKLKAVMEVIGSDNMADLPRIIRLPLSINVPTTSKRKRGNVLALCQIVRTHWHGMLLDTDDLVQRLKRVAKECNLPGRSVGKTRPVGKVRSGGRGRADVPAERLQAPAAHILRHILHLLPNHDNLDRHYQVDVAHAVQGACRGTSFEAEGKDAFLEWSSRYTPRNAVKDANLWTSISEPRSGMRKLLDLLREANPQGHGQIQAMLEPFRLAAVSKVFRDAPIDPAQSHLVQRDLSSGNDAGLNDPAQPDVVSATDGVGNVSLGNKKASLHEQAVQALVTAGAEIFRDPTGRIWIGLDGRNHLLSEKEGLFAVCGWLAKNGISLTGSHRTAFREVAESRAYIAGPVQIGFRQAEGLNSSSPEAFVNLMDGQGLGVHVSAKGWRVVPASTFPVKMADRNKSEALPQPVRASDNVTFFERLGRHMPIAAIASATDPNDAGVQQRATLICFLAAQYYRSGTVPHLLLSGDQGAGKTTTAKLLKAMTDPDTADSMGRLPTDEAVLFTVAAQQQNIVLDNMSSLRGEHSDALCMLASGTAYQKRELYSDATRTVFRAKMSVMMTSIRDELIAREDLMSRTFMMSLPPLPPSKRMTEGEIKKALHGELPHLLADFFDLLSGGLRLLPAVTADHSNGQLPWLPRVADAGLVAEAICQGAGWQKGLCIEALNAVLARASSDQLETNPVAYRIRELLRRNGGSWTGILTDLNAALLMLDGPEWRRKSPNSTKAAMKRAAVSLKEAWNIGIEEKRTSTGRWITIKDRNKKERAGG